jgi:hypothetical protein
MRPSCVAPPGEGDWVLAVGQPVGQERGRREDVCVVCWFHRPGDGHG